VFSRQWLFTKNIGVLFMRKKVLALSVCLGLTSTSLNALIAQEYNKADLQMVLKFLTSNLLLTKDAQGKKVPLSYAVGTKNDIQRYFGDFICQNQNSCSVIDTMYSNPYAILGRGLPPFQGSEFDIKAAQAQIERTDMVYGSNVYDSATWQIALALGAKHNLLNKETATKLIYNQLNRLNYEKNRATSDTFQYGYSTTISDPKKSFVFRMMATNFHNKDPFVGTKYESDIQYDYDPEKMSKNDPNGNSADFFKHVSTWSDYKPIAGENAWALLIGPLQSEALLNNGNMPVNSIALINAINSLDAFSAMQSGVGGIYYAPGGSLGNMGSIPKGEISVENNLSVLGGLQILKATLVVAPQTVEVKTALEKINVLLYGGQTISGHETKGLISFFYHYGFNKKAGVFITHGIAIDPTSMTSFNPDLSTDSKAIAVDVNTWGISALGPATIDLWYGNGTARAIWEKVKAGGGYYQNGKLLGVGFTLNNEHEKVMTSEWSAGAVTALDSLIAYYESKGASVASLKKDRTDIIAGIEQLSMANYLAANFDNAVQERYFYNMPKQYGKAYLYASKRFLIPFGWYANPLPSTCANAWVIMNAMKFNPFQFKGALLTKPYDKPENSEGGDNESDDDKNNDHRLLTRVVYNAGNLGSIDELAISYSQNGQNWVTASTNTTRSGIAMVPTEAKLLSISFRVGQSWYGACKVYQVDAICKNVNCTQTKVVQTLWSPNGSASCILVP
jgi:hypothetical protein